MSQTSTITVHVITHTNASFEEAEVRLRSTLSANVSTGYEVNCSIIPGDPYLQLVRWDGALGSFTELTASGAGCVEGDVLQATISGSGTSSVITAFKNGVQQFTWTDTGCSASWCLLPGQPGMGFYIQNVTGTAAAANAEFGASALTVTDGNAARLADGILSFDRSYDWSLAGSSAAIASSAWTQCGSTIASGASASTIQTAINACTANHFVQLGAGTFNLNTSLNFTARSNIFIQGLGADQTFLVYSTSGSCQGFGGCGIYLGSTDLNYVGAQTNIANLSGTFSQGQTSLTFSSVANLAVGKPVMLDLTDDLCSTANTDVLVAYQTNGTTLCAANGDNGGFARANRGQQQIVTVTNIAGSVVTFTPGLAMTNWASGKSPQAWWATSPSIGVGVKNLSMDMTAAQPNVGQGSAILALNCNGCFATGIRTIAPGRSHIQLQIAPHFTWSQNYSYKTAGTTSTSYGIDVAGASDSLIQTSIFQFVTEPVSVNGSCTGCVVAYNFDINDAFTPTTWRMAGNLPHAVGIDHMLFEGNQGSGLQGDIIHGTHNFITAYRNVWDGYQKNQGVNPSSNTSPVILNALNRFFNFAGNVLGTTALPQSGYESGGSPIYVLGAAETGNSGTVNSDTNVKRTLFRWGNYDISTAANRFCGATFDTGWSTTCASTTETAASITGGFPNGVPVLGDTTIGQAAMPGSLYLAAKPSDWPATKPWPPIGPDVTGGNMANLAGHAYTVPAADCYTTIMGGPADGNGSVLSFNAGTCFNGTPPAPSVTLSPVSLSFGSVTVSSPSVQSILLTNTGSATLNISSIGISGTDAAMFTKTTTCGATVVASGTCTITVTFTPTSIGSKTGSVDVTDDASGSPQSAPLSGTGITATTPSVSISNFGTINGNIVLK